MSDVWPMRMLAFVFIAAAGILFSVFFLLTMRETLRRVSGENRAMPADHVWLFFIPVFGYFWFIYMVVKVRDSLRAEYHSRGLPVEGDFGYSVGLAAGILAIICAAWSWAPSGFLLAGFVLAVGQLVCWGIYWVRIAWAKARLGGSPEGGPLYDAMDPDYPDDRDDPDDLGDDAGYCGVCGTPVLPDDRYCWRCGSSLP